jgi:hypothetical protein
MGYSCGDLSEQDENSIEGKKFSKKKIISIKLIKS